jgi:hypothetical protein
MSRNDMCRLFEVFESTHPDVISFSRNWVARYPSTPYANAARAFVLFRAGGLIRGNGPLGKPIPMPCAFIPGHTKARHPRADCLS